MVENAKALETKLRQVTHLMVQSAWRQRVRLISADEIDLSSAAMELSGAELAAHVAKVATYVNKVNEEFCKEHARLAKSLIEQYVEAANISEADFNQAMSEWEGYYETLPKTAAA